MQQIMMYSDPLKTYFPCMYAEDEAVVQKMAAALSPTCIYFFAEIDTELKNPYLPEPPEDGKHIFDGSYRCKRCAVYNRPDVESTRVVLEAPCLGRWAESGKMRAWAEDKWKGRI
jgi:hypothetical protein